jgi:hypothetical protein
VKLVKVIASKNGSLFSFKGGFLTFFVLSSPQTL